MSTLERVREAMLDVYSINEDTRARVREAHDVELLIEILAREYHQMAQALVFLRVIDILSVKP